MESVIDNQSWIKNIYKVLVRSPQKNNVLHQLNRNSKANIYNFKNRLTKDEIKQIRIGTETVSHVFYDQEWWND